MSKIYSRPRIRIPKIFYSNIQNRTDVKRKKIIRFYIIVCISFCTFRIIINAVLPVFNTICKDKAKSIATIVTNEQASAIMKEHEYDELFSIVRDNEGNIIMIKSNVGPINEIISDIALKIEKQIDDNGKNNIQIALGTFSGIKLLSGRGPGIPITISSIGNVITDLRSEFIAQGINQTLHRVYLQVECQVSILTPFEDISEKISNQVLIAENVIIGKIPSTYYNLNGLDNSNAIDIIE